MKIKENKHNVSLETLRKLVSEEMKSTERLKRGFLLESPDLLDEVGVRKNKYAFKAVFLFGPAGAGKGFISSKFLGIPTSDKDPQGFVTYNPDNLIEDIFPAFGIPLKFANAQEGDDPELEEFQQGVREQIQQWAKNEGVMKIIGAQPILFDTTGENPKKMIKRIKALGRLGYRIGVAQIYVPREISVQRDRDRERTVGASRTAAINDQYRQNVVKLRQYYEGLASEPNVHVFGSGVYPNLFNLDPETMTVGEPLPGVEPEMLEALGVETKEKAQKLLNDMRADAAEFLGMPHTEVGEMLNSAQKRMVKLTGKGGGKHYGSHSLADLELVFTQPFREEFPQAASDPLIVKAAQFLANLGGVSNFAKAGGSLPGDKKGLGGTLRSQDSKFKVDEPVRVGREFPTTGRQSRPAKGDKPQVRVREIDDIVRESVLRTLKENL